MSNRCLHISCWGALIALFLLTSCKMDMRELCDDHTHATNVQVTFDWQLSPEATAKGMAVYFYNLGKPANDPIRYDFAGMEGGTLKLTPGTWQAIAFNNDTETILLRGTESIHTMEAYTRQSSIEEGTMLTRSSGERWSTTRAENQSVILEPDELWCAVSEPFTLGIDEEPHTISFKPEPRISEIIITIRNVPNLQYTSQFGGSITDLAPSIFMASGLQGVGRATQAFTIDVIDSSTLRMHFHTFGLVPQIEETGEQPSYQLTIYAILADGKEWSYTEDVTEQLNNQEELAEGLSINIELEDLPVPKPIVNGSGFQPTIDDWQGTEIDVSN